MKKANPVVALPDPLTPASLRRFFKEQGVHWYGTDEHLRMLIADLEHEFQFVPEVREVAPDVWVVREPDGP
jgi:hypothetical protein